jgi:hypothetical protein
MTRYQYTVRTEGGRQVLQSRIVVSKVSDVSVTRDGDLARLVHADGTLLDLALDPAGAELFLDRVEMSDEGPVGEPVTHRVD